MSEQEEKRSDKRSRHARMNKRRREQLKKRRNTIIMIAAAAAAVIMIVFGAKALISNIKPKDESLRAQDGTVLEETSVKDVKHLSFNALSVHDQEGRVSAAQFEKILTQLYNEGYCLMDFYEMVYVDSEGNYAYKDTFLFPQGKKPLIISEQDVSYPYNSQELGITDKLVYKDKEFKSSYLQSDGQRTEGYCDVVPIVETFLRKHPDFSYNNARGILGVSGYNGVLGYRTTSYLASEEGNPYASYGLANTVKETEEAKKVVEALLDKGWHFASNGFGQDISYGSEISITRSDVELWAKEVQPIVGETAMILLPKATDIGSWTDYSEDNAKYKLLKDKGFSIFLLGENTTPDLLQVRSEYVRETYFTVNAFSELQAALGIQES